jgi:hypothetical protein
MCVGPNGYYLAPLGYVSVEFKLSRLERISIQVVPKLAGSFPAELATMRVVHELIGSVLKHVPCPPFCPIR